jgi:hypothetical protein
MRRAVATETKKEEKESDIPVKSREDKKNDWRWKSS